MNYIAKRTGESMSELRDRMSKGAIGVDEVEQALIDATSAGGQFYKGMEVASKTVNGQLSTLKDNAMALLGEAVKPLSDALANDLLPSAIAGVDAVTKVFTEEGFEGIAKAGYEALMKFSKGMVEGIPLATGKALDVLENIGSFLTKNVPIFIEKGFEVLTNFVDGIINAIPIMIQRLPKIISTFANVINDNFPTILKKGAELLWRFTKGIISAIPVLVKNLPQIIKAIVDTFLAFNWLNLGKTLIKNIGHGISSMGRSLWKIAKDTGRNVWNAIKSFDFKTLGKSIIQGLVDGILNMAGTAVGAVKNVAKDMFDSVKSFFGIHSPSRLMKDKIGKYLPMGIEVGFADELPRSIRSMTSELKDGVKKMHSNIKGVVTYPVNMEVDSEPSQPASMTVNQTFVNNEPTSPFEMAEETKNAIRRLEWDT